MFRQLTDFLTASFLIIRKILNREDKGEIIDCPLDYGFDLQ